MLLKEREKGGGGGKGVILGLVYSFFVVLMFLICAVGVEVVGIGVVYE